MTTTDIRIVGVDVTDQDAVGELLEWEGTPPMFSFEDPDANRYYVVEDWS